MKPFTWIALLLPLLVSCSRKKGSLSQAPSSDSLTYYKAACDSLRKVVAEHECDTIAWFDEADKQSLQEMGWTDPETEIAGDLEEHKKLIPYEGVLGGTMYFYRVSLLGDRWAIAGFEDGHVSGKALYRFRVDKNKRIEWKLVDKYMQ